LAEKKRGSLADLGDFLRSEGYGYVGSTYYERHPAGGGQSQVGDVYTYQRVNLGRGIDTRKLKLVEKGPKGHRTGRTTGLVYEHGGPDVYELEGI